MPKKRPSSAYGTDKPSRKLYGYKYDWREVDDWTGRAERPFFGSAAAPLKDSGKNKIVLLHKSVEEVAGYFPIHNQTIGDCVSHGFLLGVDVVKCVEIANGERELWVAESATEPNYGAARVEIGGGRLGNGDGCYGSWMARSVTEFGVVTRERHGSHDLRRYDGNKARQWGKRGVGCPTDLEPRMRENPIRTTSLITSYEDARDAIANGYPVAVCSNQGFQSKRDSEGFARPSGSWSHCMVFIAVDDRHRRPGLLCQNSWGPNWITGPKRHGQPDGSFWADADIADKMLRVKPDSYSLSGFVGYPARELDHRDIWGPAPTQAV